MSRRHTEFEPSRTKGSKTRMSIETEEEMKEEVEEIRSEKAKIDAELDELIGELRELKSGKKSGPGLTSVMGDLKTTTKKLITKKKDLEEKEEKVVKTAKAIIARKKSLKTVLAQIAEAEQIDLCFMVDCTGSMSSLISAVKTQIKSIVSDLKKRLDNFKVRLSFVGYRDICDGAGQFSILDFTDSIPKFEDFVGRVVATGGGDGPEDIAGALLKLQALDWKFPSKVMIHIADAPCHGTEYHDGWGDDYPSGVGIDITDQVSKIRSRNIAYCFARLTYATDKMIDKINRDLGKAFIEVTSLDGAGAGLTELVVKTTMTTITETTKGFGDGAAIETKDGEPDWSKVSLVTVDVTSVDPGAYSKLDDLKEATKEFRKYARDIRIKVCPYPFGKGAIRAAYYGKLLTDKGAEVDMVFKQFFKARVYEEYMKALEGNMVAKYLAEYYNSKVKPSSDKVITFLRNDIVSIGSDKHYFMETKLEGKFEKFCDNAGRWKKADQSLLRFCKWTYDVLDGFLMVSDLQGVESDSEFVLTDPVILCKDRLRFGEANLGPEGLVKFYNSVEKLLDDE